MENAMQLNLEGKVVIVTGGAQGIGRVIAETFVAERAVVVVCDLPGAQLEAVAASAASGGIVPIACDVTNSAQVNSVVGEVVQRFGRIDVLVNNAGVNVDGPIEDLDDERWSRCFDVNVGGVFRMSKAAIPVMKAQRAGRIINAASFAAIIPSVGSAAYAASKAAVVQFTRVLAGELGPWDVTVNAYAPGMIPTAMNGFATMPTEAQDRLLDTLTLRRWEKPQDVANLLCFLASDAASYITGALIDVSGGKLATQIPARAYELAAAAE
jgi:3-oxoacyl-[acyl-carrier protein] reductase